MPEQLSLMGFDSAAKATDRLFFAVFPEVAVAADISRLTLNLRREHGLKGQPLQTERLHVTLHHLGDYAGLPQEMVASAIHAAGSVAMPQFEVAFDHTLSFSARPGNRPFVLRGREGVVALTALQQALGLALRKVGLKGGTGSQYMPHMTLLYDDRRIAEQPVEPVNWVVREFVLVHSLLGRTVHVPLARWSLASALGS